MKNILYLPIETVARDLDPSLFLAHHALRRGFAIVVGEKAEVKRSAQRVGGGVYIYKHWEALFPYRFDDERRKNYCYVGYHQEGLVYIDEQTFLRRMTEKDRSSMLDLNLVKGEEQRRLLLEFNPTLRPILHAVGAPTFDILRPRYAQLFERLARSLTKKWGPYVLINTNFYPGNRRRHETDDIIAEREKSSLKNVGRPLTDEEKEVLRGSIAYKARMYEEYVRALKALAPRFPHLRFIVRPHPSEDHERWREDLAGTANVHVIFKYNVVNWIVGALAVVHTGCTTALEAWALGKPVIRFNPEGRTNSFESPLPNRLGVFAGSIEELVSAIQKAENGELGSSFEAQKEIVRPYLASVDGLEAADRVLDLIESVTKHNERVSVEVHAKLRIRALLWRILVVVLSHDTLTRYVLGRDRALRYAGLFQKFPGISRNHVNAFMRALDAVNGARGDIVLRRIDANTFLMQNREYE